MPIVWRILARNVHYLRSTWRKEAALMAAGALSARDKRRVALGVAMATRARYMIEYHTAVLRHAGDTDRDLLEILGVVDHCTTLNTLSEAMHIESGGVCSTTGCWPQLARMRAPAIKAMPRPAQAGRASLQAARQDHGAATIGAPGGTAWSLREPVRCARDPA